ncbi:MAG TPA: CDP-alcohol phosphatidyltransferase family protein [Thermomicrobiales bacterium]|nr:CDP-alcohol phosphatidyltransferase family protein [Thermomicrobiales bacterium]
MANLITVGRICLLFVTVALIYFGNVAAITLCMLLIGIVFILDGADGWVARRRGETSQLGAVFDIAGDRIVENVLWVVFADLELVPIWVPLLVITRGFIVDGLRSISFAEGMTAFGEHNMMRSPLTRWLTAGRFMRGLFGYDKALGFVFLTGLEAYRHHDTDGTLIGSVYGNDAFRLVGWALVWLAVALTVIRGLPVIFDAIALWGRPVQAPAGQSTTAPMSEDRLRDGVPHAPS